MESALHLITVGTFGKTVARHLRTLIEFRETTVAAGAMRDQVWSMADINVVVAWRPMPRLCAVLDDLSFERRTGFLPLILDGTAMIVGPFVVPGAGSCWHCWNIRCQQHAAWPNEREALLDYYASHPAEGPNGYLEPFAMMGAARINEAVTLLQREQAIPGEIWQIDMLSLDITQTVAVGVHDCPRCGLRRPSATRNFSMLQKRLAYLWPETSNE
jgi:bacteriocin biosynthesis cyclodehydratase domain-containing protein